MHKAEHVLYTYFSGNLKLLKGSSYISVRMVLLNIHAAHPEMFETQITCMMSLLLFLHAQQLYSTESFYLLGLPMTVAVLRGAIKETHTSLYSFSCGLLCNVTHFLLELLNVVMNTDVQNSAS
jgi:hypothetical protein